MEDALATASPRVFPGAHLRPPYSLRSAYGFTGAFVALLGGVIAFVPELRAVMAVFGGLLLPPLLGGLFWLRKRSPAGGQGVEVRPEGVFVGGVLALPRGEIEQAVVAQERSGPTVSFQRKRGLVSVIDVQSEQEGRQIVEALGLDARHTTSTFAFDSPLAQRMSAPVFYGYIAAIPLLCMGLIAAIPGLGIAAMPPLMMLWYAGLLASAIPQKMTVGLDGVRVDWLGRKRLIPFSGIDDVEVRGHELHLRLRGGQRVPLSARWLGQAWERGLVKAQNAFASRAVYLEAVRARLQEAQEASGAAGAQGAPVALEQGGREVKAWLSDLRGLLGEERRGFRRNEVSPEQLWSALEDASAAPRVRVAAAVALGSGLDEEGKGRLRVAASTVASDGLRVALEAASRGDDEALAEALGKLDAEASRAQAR